MSCVISLKYNNHFVMVSDTQASRPYSGIFSNFVDGREEKLLAVKNSDCAIFGQVGNCWSYRVVNEIPNLLERDENEEFNIEFVVDKVVPKFKHLLYSLNYIDSEDQFILDNEFIIAERNKCFVIKDKSEVFEVDDLAFFGSGFEASMGAYYGSPLDNDKFIRVLKGIRAAIKYNNGCGYPVIVKTTLDNKIRYLLSEEELNEVIEGRKVLDI